MLSPRMEIAVAALLTVAVVGTGVAVVATKHDARQLFAELEELKREQDRLQVDWGRLQLEQSALGTHARIESVARESLELGEPDFSQLRIIMEPNR